MKYKRLLIILGAVIFFISALTSYTNRVIFPRLIKKIVIEHLEDTLKRKVEIGALHFNWVKGFIIDKVKVYEKGPNSTIFAQADQVSFGIVIFPNAKHYRVTIPFINVRSPSIHLIRTSPDTWNFSDIFAAPNSSAAAPSTPTGTAKAPSIELAWGGITISDGKMLVDDTSASKAWSEYFDNINLKLTLSYKGISYDFTAAIPAKNGVLGASVYYQPITHDTQAKIHLKNIDTASYLSLVNIPDMDLKSGVIKQIDLDITYTKDRTCAQGNVLIKDMDIASDERKFKGDIELRGLDALYQNGAVNAHSAIILNHFQTSVPGLSAGGSIQAQVNTFEMTPDGLLNFVGSLQGQDIFVRLKDRQVQVDAVSLDNIKVRKDNDSVQSVGSIITKGLLVQWPDQKLQGDISLKAVTMTMKDLNNIQLEGDLDAEHLATQLKDNALNAQHLSMEDFHLSIQDQQNVTLNTNLSVDTLAVDLGDALSIKAGSLKTDRLSLRDENDLISTSATLDMTQGSLKLAHQRRIDADPRLELSLQIPLKDPEQLSYKGSITLSNGHIEGFPGIPTLDNIELDADFKNDEATINALSINLMDTNIRINGTLKDFKKPLLNIVAEADELNLAQLKHFAPELIDRYDLNIDGSASLKVKFEGLAADPLAGRILAVGSVKNAAVDSNKLHQHINHITGIIEATPDSLKWRDTTADYQGQKYALSGSLDDFKHPKIVFTLDGPNLHLNGDLLNSNTMITVNTLNGTFMGADFSNTGTILLTTGEEPSFDLNSNVSFTLAGLLPKLPTALKSSLAALDPSGMIRVTTAVKGTGLNWKNYQLHGTLTCPLITLKGYKLNDMKISIDQAAGKINNLSFDGKLYSGTVHAVGSLDMTARGMPYEGAFNIDGTDLHLLKMDSPLKMDEINGKFYLTALAHGTVADFKENLHATGSLAIRDGFLGEFNLFKGLLGILNDAMRLGQIEITDVEGNFTVDDQKINTDNLRLKGPTIVLLSKGWVDFDQMCNLDVTVDLSSGVVPDIAHDVLNTLNIHIYDNIANPKFKKKISVPQVINTLLKNLLQ